MFKKLLISILIGTTFLISLGPFSQAKAQTTWYNQSLPEWYLKVYDNSNQNEIFGERYTAAQVQWIIYSLPSMFINLVTGGNTDVASCFMGAVASNIQLDACVDGLTNFINDSTVDLGLTENTQHQPSIASQIFADRPISGISYVKNIIRKLDPVTEVHAQTTGYGYTVLTVIRPLWGLTRNFSFFLFVIVTIVFAFMIMLRVKLSPQLVISVQSALPKIVISLILVTFSFAIAGFMIDLIYVIMGVFSAMMSSFIPTNFLKVAEGKIIFAFINGSIPLLQDGGIAIFFYFIAYIILFFVAAVVALLASVSGFHISSTLFSLLLIIFTIILLLILIVSTVRVIFMLFKNLAAVYGLIIIAPLQITMGTLFPQSGFSSWLKKLFSKLLVFPLTGIFIYISFFLLGYSMATSVYGAICNNGLMSILKPVLRLELGLISKFTGIEFFDPANTLDFCNAWGPPMLGNPASATAIAFLLMSVGIIMMIPKISEAIESFMAGKEFAGTGIGEALGPFSGVASGVQKYGAEAGTTYAAGRLQQAIESRGGGRGAMKVLNDILKSMQKQGGQPGTGGQKGPGER